MIYIMGDLHGHYDIFKNRIINNDIKIHEKDKIIVCGDFSFIYDGSLERINGLLKLQKEKCEILFVCGNHENFAELLKYPEIDKYDAKMKCISNNIYYMLRGNVYSIDGITFFAFGGGYSNPNHSTVLWQPQEVPSHFEILYGETTLHQYNNTVDYIITHSAPNEILLQLDIVPFYDNTEFTSFLSYIYHNVSFSKWFCGHYHRDSTLNNDTFSIVYDKIHRICNHPINLSPGVK